MLWPIANLDRRRLHLRHRAAGQAFRHAQQATPQRCSRAQSCPRCHHIELVGPLHRPKSSVCTWEPSACSSKLQRAVFAKMGSDRHFGHHPKHPLGWVKTGWVVSEFVDMTMIAFITIKSSLVPLIEGLCAQIYLRCEISVVCSHLLLFFFVKEKTC